VAHVAPRQPADEREVLLDQTRSGAEIAVTVVLAEQTPDGRTA
jgi:hypothetical protein